MTFRKGQPSWNKGKRIPPEARFFRFVEKREDGCWIWKGGKSGRGYGYFWIKQGHQERAHRYSYEMHYKKKIPEGMFICHSCDVPLCVNPEHLWVGTPKENTQDAIKKGIVGSVGASNPNSRLTEKEVEKIRGLYASGKYSQQKIADKFGVCQVHVSAIVRHKMWK